VLGRESVPLFRAFGIRVGATPSWFFVLFLLIYILTGYFGDVLDSTSTEAFLVAVAAALLFELSLVLHELGHAVVARRHGIGIAGIDLWFFGGLAKLTREPRTPGEEFKVAAAGPAVTLVVIAVCFGVGLLVSRLGDIFDSATFTDARTTPVTALLGFLVVINAVLLAFNLVPAFPLDGGRIARAAAWRATGDRNRGTRISARLGQAFSYVLMGFGIYLLLRGDVFNGIWFLLLGWFMGQAARGAVVSSRFSERLEGVTVEQVMDPQPVSMPASATVTQAHDEFFLRYRWPWFPVVDGEGRFAGLLREEHVDAALSDGRPLLPVADLLDGAERDEAAVRDDTPIEHLLGDEHLRRLGALMVTDAEGRLAGVVTIEQVRRALTAAAPTGL
jgi:Zn-dependent protease